MLGRMRIPTPADARAWQMAEKMGISLGQARKKIKDLERGLAAAKDKDGTVEVRSFGDLAKVFAARWATGEKPLPDRAAVV